MTTEQIRGPAPKEREPAKNAPAERPLPRILRSFGLGLLGLMFGLVLLGLWSIYTARREVHEVRAHLASLRVFEVRERLLPLLASETERKRATDVFAALDEAALDARVMPEEVERLRHELDAATADFTLTPDETSELLEHADALVD